MYIQAKLNRPFKSLLICNCCKNTTSNTEKNSHKHEPVAVAMILPIVEFSLKVQCSRQKFKFLDKQI